MTIERQGSRLFLISHGWTRIFYFGNERNKVDEFSLLGTIPIRRQTSSSVCIRG